jgi:putative phosphoesterase
VLAEVIRHKINQLLITGDLVGYYFHSKEVFDLLFMHTSTFVRGNHENMLQKSRYNRDELKWIEPKYGSGLRSALETLAPRQLNMIENMPSRAFLNVEGCKILLCHGTPSDPEAYLYPDAPQEVLREFGAMAFDFIIMGHTHYPMDIKAGNVRLVNPGSVGQPRTKEKGASWAILDTKTREVIFRSESYDSTSLINECRIRHPGIPYLAEVLCEK